MQNAEFANSDICCFNKINGAAAKKVLLKKTLYTLRSRTALTALLCCCNCQFEHCISNYTITLYNKKKDWCKP